VDKNGDVRGSGKVWQGEDGHFAILAGYLEVRALWISMSMVGWWLSFARHIPS